MKSAVIFDLFGTLIHLARNTRPYWRLCCATNSAGRMRDSQVVDAPTLGDFCDHLAVPHPSNISELQRDLEEDIERAELFEDTITTLEALRSRDIPMALISNLASPYKLAFYNLGLNQFFDCVFFSCDVQLAKPHPDIYRLALDGLAIDASRVIMIGDNWRADVDGPGSCGIHGHLIDRSVPPSHDSCLRTLTEVTALIK